MLFLRNGIPTDIGQIGFSMIFLLNVLIFIKINILFIQFICCALFCFLNYSNCKPWSLINHDRIFRRILAKFWPNFRFTSAWWIFSVNFWRYFANFRRCLDLLSIERLFPELSPNFRFTSALWVFSWIFRRFFDLIPPNGFFRPIFLIQSHLRIPSFVA